MANATSTFLQGANAANAAMGASGPPASTAPVDRSQVLAAISKPEVSNLAALASELNVTVGSVSPTVESLSNDGLVETVDDQLHLSASGERALRYINISKVA
jgi:predicted transcriptional regulator